MSVVLCLVPLAHYVVQALQPDLNVAPLLRAELAVPEAIPGFPPANLPKLPHEPPRFLRRVGPIFRALPDPAWSC